MLWAVAAAGFPVWWRVRLDMTPHGTQPGLASGDIDRLTPAKVATAAITSPSGPSCLQRLVGPAMANATRDPLFWAALDVANHDVPGAGDCACVYAKRLVRWPRLQDRHARRHRGDGQ